MEIRRRSQCGIARGAHLYAIKTVYGPVGECLIGAIPDVVLVAWTDGVVGRRNLESVGRVGVCRDVGCLDEEEMLYLGEVEGGDRYGEAAVSVVSDAVGVAALADADQSLGDVGVDVVD
jgi:hypothetical protein